MRNWKTTLAAGISATAAFVLYASTAHYIEFPNWAVGIAGFVHAGGLLAFGVAAKDYDVTGVK